jgi:protein gp37
MCAKRRKSMSNNSTIEWTDASWNPVTGCKQISPGCDHCYALTFAERWRGVPGHPYEQGFDLRLWPERLELPLTWKKPRKIFVNSMSDIFHEDIPDEFVLDIFRTMLKADWHIYQLLTKRAPRMVRLIPQIDELLWQEFGLRAWPAHIWCGVTVESSAQRGRIAALRKVPAGVRFISYEPALGLLDADLSGIHWLIAGAESGHGARPMDLDWIRFIRDRCQQQGVAFFFKQKADRTGHKISLPDLDGEVWQQYPVIV